MFLLKLYIEHLDDATRRSYYHLKLQRAVQDLVTVCLEDGWKYFGLVNIKHYEEYLYNHSINVAVLSLVMGVKLKLRRSCLVELGMAAILHDLGKALLPRTSWKAPALLRTRIAQAPDASLLGSRLFSAAGSSTRRFSSKSR